MQYVLYIHPVIENGKISFLFKQYNVKQNNSENSNSILFHSHTQFKNISKSIIGGKEKQSNQQTWKQTVGHQRRGEWEIG